MEQVHQLDPKNDASAKYIDPSKVKAKMIFPISTIIQCKANDVDLDYATKGKQLNTVIETLA